MFLADLRSDVDHRPGLQSDRCHYVAALRGRVHMKIGPRFRRDHGNAVGYFELMEGFSVVDEGIQLQVRIVERAAGGVVNVGTVQPETGVSEMDRRPRKQGSEQKRAGDED